ncbi:MAG: flagellar hook-basal body complex protein FliE [Brucellaceae bacterium]|nr:flagellar hook-basal body complex protein FliE [Brucellaceae bacterium]
MPIGALTALNLLSTAQGVLTAVTNKPEPQTEASVATSFADALNKAAGDTISSMQDAEKLSVSALQGGADMREVIDAVMDAEQSLRAAISIRDKIVQSYLEVSRMPI